MKDIDTLLLALECILRGCENGENVYKTVNAFVEQLRPAINANLIDFTESQKMICSSYILIFLPRLNADKLAKFTELLINVVADAQQLAIWELILSRTLQLIYDTRSNDIVHFAGVEATGLVFYKNTVQKLLVSPIDGKNLITMTKFLQ